MNEFGICKRCGIKHNKDFMHYSIMYHGIICNNSFECLKDKQIKENEKKCNKCGTELERVYRNKNLETLFCPNEKCDDWLKWR